MHVEVGLWWDGICVEMACVHVNINKSSGIICLDIIGLWLPPRTYGNVSHNKWGDNNIVLNQATIFAQAPMWQQSAHLIYVATSDFTN